MWCWRKIHGISWTATNTNNIFIYIYSGIARRLQYAINCIPTVYPNIFWRHCASSLPNIGFSNLKNGYWQSGKQEKQRKITVALE